MFLAKKLNNGAGSPAAPADAKFNYVTMLLHGDGTNGAQNNTFLDSSTNNFTITRNGNTTQGSFSPYGSNWSNNFPTTSGDYLTIANNAAFTLGNTFTVECWLFRTASDDGTIVGRWYAGDSSGWLMHIFSGGKLAFGLGSGSYSNASASTIPLNTWTHLAVSNDTTSKRFYINGVLDATFSSDNCNSLGSINLTICQNTGGGYGIRSYISNLRIVKGTAVYTSNFTPPTAPLTAISGTSLLTCQSNRFIDNSTNNFTITPSGSPSVQRFNPFGTSTAYSTSVIGGSGYFDGSGDYLTIANNSAFYLTTNSFTVEAWVYLTAAATSGNTSFLFGNVLENTGGGGYLFYIGADLKPVIYYTTGGTYNPSGAYTSSTAMPLNAWTHLAFVRSGNNWNIYINGVSTAAVTQSNSVYSSSNTFAIGADLTGSNKTFLTGYISNLRFVNGTAVYTTNFTPPTAPLTAITNTVLLTSMTNGAIYDNAMMNDLETVGNAQISTSVVKYGTGSLKFDGTGDYLSTPASPNLSFGSGDFTIECWVYANSLGSYNAVFAQWPDNGGTTNNSFTLESVGSSMDFYCASGTSLYGPATLGTITTGVWIHYAICRSGNTLYPFKNGVLGTTLSLSQTLNTSTYPVTVGGQVAGAGYWDGYIDDLRITKGYARYTSNFTPPTAAFSNTGPI